MAHRKTTNTETTSKNELKMNHGMMKSDINDPNLRLTTNSSLSSFWVSRMPQKPKRMLDPAKTPFMNSGSTSIANGVSVNPITMKGAAKARIRRKGNTIDLIFSLYRHIRIPVSYWIALILKAK